MKDLTQKELKHTNGGGSGYGVGYVLGFLIQGMFTMVRP